MYYWKLFASIEYSSYRFSMTWKGTFFLSSMNFKIIAKSTMCVREWTYNSNGLFWLVLGTVDTHSQIRFQNVNIHTHTKERDGKFCECGLSSLSFVSILTFWSLWNHWMFPTCLWVAIDSKVLPVSSKNRCAFFSRNNYTWIEIKYIELGFFTYQLLNFRRKMQKKNSSWFDSSSVRSIHFRWSEKSTEKIKFL